MYPRIFNSLHRCKIPSAIQQFARDHPACGDDVCPVPLSLRQVEDLLSGRGIDICHETVRFWWNRFGPLFAAEIRKRIFIRPRTGAGTWTKCSCGSMGRRTIWRAVDHEGEVLEVFATKRRDRRAALTFLKRAIATSVTATSSRRTVLPTWPSGVNWRPERLRPAPFAGRFRFV